LIRTLYAIMISPVLTGAGRSSIFELKKKQRSPVPTKDRDESHNVMDDMKSRNLAVLGFRERPLLPCAARVISLNSATTPITFTTLFSSRSFRGVNFEGFD
jgi:hypothetical protein